MNQSVNTARVTNTPHARTPTGADAGHAVEGTIRGGWVKVAPPRDDVDDVLYAKAQRETMLGLHRTQLLGPQAAAHVRDVRSAMHVDHKPLSSRKMRLDQPAKLLRPADIVQAQRREGNGLEVRQLALKLLRDGKLPPTRPGERGAVASFLTLHSALAFLDEASDEKDALALLTPARGQPPARRMPSDARELAEMLQQAGDDAHALAEILKDVEGLPPDPYDLYNLLKHVRYDPPALVQLLREKQGLPQDKQVLSELRENVHAALFQLELTNGKVIRTRLNGGPAADETADPSLSLDVHSELLHANANFAETGKKMVERFKPENLRMGVDFRVKALGDDLNETVTAIYCDPRHRHAIISDLGHMHEFSTLLELTDQHIERMERTLNAERAAPAA